MTICDQCQKRGTWSENHNECEINYINNRRNKGIARTSEDCQCENIGHGWNVTVDVDRPVTDNCCQALWFLPPRSRSGPVASVHRG